jgi:2-methylisocitrate lyase-like PEP mutase family enzyme
LYVKVALSNKDIYERFCSINLEELNIDICARTDRRGVEGLDKAIDRAKAYIQGFFFYLLRR